MRSKVSIPLQNLFNHESMDLFGFYYKYDDEYYFVTLNHNLPIQDHIILNEKKIPIFKNCVWNEIVVTKIKPKNNKKFVFYQGGKKQILENKRYYFGENKEFMKYEGESFLEINMIPNNPKNLYYKFKCKSFDPDIGESGTPILDDQDNIIGIFSKYDIKRKIAYVIPYLYIEKSITKQNKIFSVDYEISKIRKIYRYKVINSKIYYQPLNKYILLSTYFLLEGRIKKQIIVEKDNCVITKLNYKTIINDSCNNNIVKKDTKNHILITSGLLLLLKYLDNYKLLREIMSNNRFEYEHNEKKYLFIQ